MGVYVALQVLSRQLNPSSPDATFGPTARVPSRRSGRGGGGSLQPGGSFYKPVLPKFLLPRTYSMPIPGSRIFLYTGLANMAPDISPLITGDLNSDRLCVLKVR